MRSAMYQAKLGKPGFPELTQSLNTCLEYFFQSVLGGVIYSVVSDGIHLFYVG